MLASKKDVMIDMVCRENWRYGQEIFEHGGFQINFCYFDWRGCDSFPWNADDSTPLTSDNESEDVKMINR